MASILPVRTAAKAVALSGIIRVLNYYIGELVLRIALVISPVIRVLDHGLRTVGNIIRAK